MGQETDNLGYYIPSYGERYDDEKDADWRDLDSRLQNISADGTTFSPDTLTGGVVGGASLLTLLGQGLRLDENGALRMRNSDIRSAVEGETDVADLSGSDGSDGQVPQTDGTDVSWVDADFGGDTQAVSLVANGSATLNEGSAEVDTAVTVDDTRYYDVWPSPPSGVDVAASLEADSATGTYHIHLEENSTSVGTPTVSWQFVRSEKLDGSGTTDPQDARVDELHAGSLSVSGGESVSAGPVGDAEEVRTEGFIAAGGQVSTQSTSYTKVLGQAPQSRFQFFRIYESSSMNVTNLSDDVYVGLYANISTDTDGETASARFASYGGSYPDTEITNTGTVSGGQFAGFAGPVNVSQFQALILELKTTGGSAIVQNPHYVLGRAVE